MQLSFALEPPAEPLVCDIGHLVGKWLVLSWPLYDHLRPFVSLADLVSLPFGALRKAHHQLAQAHALDDSEDEASSNDDDEPEIVSRSDPQGKGKEPEERKPKPDIPKRTSKHA